MYLSCSQHKILIIKSQSINCGNKTERERETLGWSRNGIAAAADVAVTGCFGKQDN